MLCLVLPSISFLDYSVKGWKATKKQWVEVPLKEEEEGHGGHSIDGMSEITMLTSLTFPCRFQRRLCRCRVALALYVNAVAKWRKGRSTFT